MVQVLQSVLIPATTPMAQTLQPVPANTPMVQVQPSANPQNVTHLVGTGTETRTRNNNEARTVTVLTATQYTQAVRQHHMRTFRLILARREFLGHIPPSRLIAIDDSIRRDADWVCDNVERGLMHGVRILEIIFSIVFSFVFSFFFFSFSFLFLFFFFSFSFLFLFFCRVIMYYYSAMAA